VEKRAADRSLGDLVGQVLARGEQEHYWRVPPPDRQGWFLRA
jgi:4'-phosphopantetheinyl transferase